MSVRHPLVNQLGFLACWWLCASYADAGAAAASVLLVLHVFLQPRRARELAVIALCAACGLLVDALLAGFGWLAFGSQHLLPFWLCVLWAAFAATLNHALAFLQRRLALAALLGALGGPFSYWSGTLLGRVGFPAPLGPTLLVLGLAWALLLPAQLALARRLAPG